MLLELGMTGYAMDKHILYPIRQLTVKYIRGSNKTTGYFYCKNGINILNTSSSPIKLSNRIKRYLQVQWISLTKIIKNMIKKIKNKNEIVQCQQKRFTIPSNPNCDIKIIFKND